MTMVSYNFFVIFHGKIVGSHQILVLYNSVYYKGTTLTYFYTRQNCHCTDMHRSRKFCQRFFSLVWWGEEGSKYHYKWAIIGLPTKHHSNGVSLAGRWWPNIECWIGSFVILRGSRPVFLRNQIFLEFSRGGRVWTPCPPPLDHDWPVSWHNLQ